MKNSPPSSSKMASLPHPPPHFFKMVLQKSLEDKQLMIPKKFVQEYGKFLSSSVCLKVPDGKEWKVGLKTATNGAVWLQNGWLSFAEYYCLEFGSMLVFRLDGNSTFHTLIFDATGSEIEYSLDFNHFEGDFKEENDANYSDESLNNASFPCQQPYKKMKSEASFLPKMEPQDQECYILREKPSCKRIPEDRISRRRQPLSSTAENAKEPQIFSSSKSEKPGFRIVVGKSSPGGRFKMTIPKDFAQKYLPEEVGIIRIQTLDGGSWSLLYKWSPSRGGFAYISRGWKRFVEENLLKIGDVGFFKLIEKHQFLFTIEETSASPSHSPNKNAATIRNPFFEVVVRFNSYQSSTLNIPMGFAKKHLSAGMHSARLEVGKKQWKVTIKNYEKCIRFTSGWGIFYRENCLQDGDTCIFELLNKNDSHCAFKVTIFKEATSSLSDSVEEI